MNAFIKPIHSVSIRTLLIGAFLTLMMFPLLVIALITYHKENEIIQKQTSHYLLQTVEQTQHALDANLAEIDRLTWALLYNQSSGTDFLNGTFDSPYQTFEARQRFKEKFYSDLFRGRLEFIQAVHFVTPERSILSTDNSFRSYSQLDQPNYEYIVSQIDKGPLQLYWFSKRREIYHPKESFDTPIKESITAARRLIDSNSGQVKGYLFIQFNDRFIEENLHNVQIGVTGAIFVTDRSGDRVYQQERLVMDNVKLNDAIASIGNKERGYQIINNQWLLAFNNSEVSGWEMTAVVPMNELIGTNQQVLRYLLLMILLGAFVSIIISYLLATSISNPVIHLARHMSSRSLNRLKEAHNPIREISILNRNFNHLILRICELIKQNEVQEQEKRDALLKALQMQINPHFLYNILDTIYWMSMKYKAESVSKMITALGRFFRFTLNSGREWITLQHEMEHIQNYLVIQSYRYKDKFKYQLSIEDTIRNSTIMPLILQPLVENAIEHGVSKSNECGTISITAGKIGDRVCISIANTGGRLDLEHVNRLLKEEYVSEHVGLRNVQQRIQLAFGKEYGLHFSVNQMDGTVVIVTLPYREWIAADRPEVQS